MGKTQSKVIPWPPKPRKKENKHPQEEERHHGPLPASWPAEEEETTRTDTPTDIVYIKVETPSGKTMTYSVPDPKDTTVRLTWLTDRKYKRLHVYLVIEDKEEGEVWELVADYASSASVTDVERRG